MMTIMASNIIPANTEPMTIPAISPLLRSSDSAVSVGIIVGVGSMDVAVVEDVISTTAFV